MREISVGKNLTADTLTTLYTAPRNHTARFYTLYALELSLKPVLL